MARKSSPSKQGNAHFGGVFSVLGEFCRGCAMSEEMTVWQVCSLRPIGGHHEAWRAWPGFEPTCRAKLAARTASGRAGLAVAGDLAGRGRGRRSGGVRQRPEAWRGAAEAGDLAGCGRDRRSGGARKRSEIWRGAAEAGDLVGYGQYWKTNGGTDAKKPATRRPPVVCASWGT